MAAQSCVGKAHCAREFLSPNFVRECMPRGQRKRIYEKSEIEFERGSVIRARLDASQHSLLSRKAKALRTSWRCGGRKMKNFS